MVLGMRRRGCRTQRSGHVPVVNRALKLNRSARRCDESTWHVAAEARSTGIRVNTTVPGAMLTSMTADILVGSHEDLSGAEQGAGGLESYRPPGSSCGHCCWDGIWPATTRAPAQARRSMWMPGWSTRPVRRHMRPGNGASRRDVRSGSEAVMAHDQPTSADVQLSELMSREWALCTMWDGSIGRWPSTAALRPGGAGSRTSASARGLPSLPAPTDMACDYFCRWSAPTGPLAAVRDLPAEVQNPLRIDAEYLKY